MSAEMDARADALLAEMDLAEGAERQAGIVLAGVALALAGGDPEAAKGPLAEVLTAIGVLGYEPAVTLNMWGQRKSERSDETSGDAA